MIAARRCAVCFATLLAGCGGGPTAPSEPQQQPGTTASCRTFATRQTATYSSASNVPGVPAFEGSSTTSCSFDRQSATLRCEITTTFAPCISNSSQTSSTSYASVADFVDEGALLGRTLATSGSSSGGSTSVPSGGGCVSAPLPASTQSYTYDAQRRLTSASDSNGGLTTYTGWDASGRPTRGTLSLSGCSSLPLSIAYDDASRTVAYVTERGGIGTCPLVTSMTTYDALGMPSRTSSTGTVSGPSGDVVTTTVGVNMVSATAQVCK